MHRKPLKTAVKNILDEVYQLKVKILALIHNADMRVGFTLNLMYAFRFF